MLVPLGPFTNKERSKRLRSMGSLRFSEPKLSLTATRPRTGRLQNTVFSIIIGSRPQWCGRLKTSAKASAVLRYEVLSSSSVPTRPLYQVTNSNRLHGPQQDLLSITSPSKTILVSRSILRAEPLTPRPTRSVRSGWNRLFKQCRRSGGAA